MFLRKETTALVFETFIIFLILDECSSLIITSVIAGNKKFKTVSFDSKFLKPLMFEKDLPSTEFRRHRTMRPPKFDIDVNIPIKLPLEEEYPQEEYKKPVESNIFFQTGEIKEPYHDKKYPESVKYENKSPTTYRDSYAASASEQQASQVVDAQGKNVNINNGLRGLLPVLAKSIRFQPSFEVSGPKTVNDRSDHKESLQQHPIQQSARPVQQNVINDKQLIQTQQADMMTQQSQNLDRSYAPAQPYQQSYQQDNYQQNFVPGGYINLQLSGPKGGPKMTYEDYDKERWAQQMSQTDGAMPYPILNYHQLQNFYGGLGTFTNGLAENRYVQTGILEKLKSSLNHVTGKFHALG